MPQLKGCVIYLHVWCLWKQRIKERVLHLNSFGLGHNTYENNKKRNFFPHSSPLLSLSQKNSLFVNEMQEMGKKAYFRKIVSDQNGKSSSKGGSSFRSISPPTEISISPVSEAKRAPVFLLVIGFAPNGFELFA